MRDELLIEAIDLADIDTLEEDITPCTGCVCTCTDGGGGTGGGGKTGGDGGGTCDPNTDTGCDPNAL